VCPFCGEKGNFSLSNHAEKKKPNSSKCLNFDLYMCPVAPGTCRFFGPFRESCKTANEIGNVFKRSWGLSFAVRFQVHLTLPCSHTALWT
jgi:hypothetical protein